MAVLTRNWRLLASSSNGRGLSTVGNSDSGGETKLVKIPELGDVKGSSSVTAWTQRKFYQFLGIRYAEPPIGKLRFKVSSQYTDNDEATGHWMSSLIIETIILLPGTFARQSVERCLRRDETWTPSSDVEEYPQEP